VLFRSSVAARVVRVASKGTKQAGRDVVIFEAILDVIDPDDRVRPGMTANVEIEVAKRENAVTVPVEAVIHRMRKELDDNLLKTYDATQANLELSDRARQAQYIKVVYVKDGDTARVRIIQPGIADSRRVEILSGVTPDDDVIIGPYRSLDQLKDGKKVSLMEEDTTKEGALADADENEKNKDEDKSEDDSDDSKDDDDSSDATARKDP